MDEKTVRCDRHCRKCGGERDGSHASYCKKCFAAYVRLRNFLRGATPTLSQARFKPDPGKKRCARCKAVHPAIADFFGSNRGSRDGFDSYCRSCSRANSAARRARAPKMSRPSLAERFWEKVDKNGPIPPHRPELGPCWLWSAYLNQKGYGQISVGGRGGSRELAHRVAFCLENGLEISDIAGSEVAHHCDTPRCVRPSHLFLASHQDNVDDMVAKGRQQRGERNGHAKLSSGDVVNIRRRHAAGESIASIAGAFVMSRAAVRSIVLRRNWRHVP